MTKYYIAVGFLVVWIAIAIFATNYILTQNFKKVFKIVSISILTAAFLGLITIFIFRAPISNFETKQHAETIINEYDIYNNILNQKVTNGL
jgi:fructose-specific phosphotransferase system IIC component